MVLNRSLTHVVTGLLILTSTALVRAQDATSYQTPPKALADLVTAPPTPGVSGSPGYIVMSCTEPRWTP